MPFKDPDPTDPNMLVGVHACRPMPRRRATWLMCSPKNSPAWATRESSCSGLFKNPFYGGAHGAYRALGENGDAVDYRRVSERLGKHPNKSSRRSSSSNRSSPLFILPRDAGEERDGSFPAPNERINLRNGLNGAKRLNDWNGLNPRREESDDE